MTEPFMLPMLNYDEGTPEQVAQRLAAHSMVDEINRLEDESRATGWASVHRVRALAVAEQLRGIAAGLFALGTVGLETRAAFELARIRGFPCEKCGHRHEGSRFHFRCFLCQCQEREDPQRISERISQPK